MKNRPSSFSLLRMLERKPSGSFFHKVPDNHDKDDDDEYRSISNRSSNDDNNISAKEEQSRQQQDPFDESLQQVMKSRKSRPRASSPSTLGGIPISEAKGECTFQFEYILYIYR